jgi:hypothetical protein
MEEIILKETRLVKNPYTKTTYTIEEEKTEAITRKQYSNICGKDTLKWFRRLGGSETAERGYTCAGYLIVKLTSTSPDKQNKTIRTFKFN